MFGLSGLLALFSGASGIAGKLADAYAAKQAATTDAARIAADERIATLQAQAALQTAEAGSRINTIVRAALAIPVIIFLWKVIVFDKVLGLGSTDNLSSDLWTFADIVIGFYFLHAIVRG